MTLEQVYEDAKKVPASGRMVRVTDKWLPVVAMLREKNFTYEDIWKFLRERGQNVHDSPRVFASAMSRRYRHWLKTQIR